MKFTANSNWRDKPAQSQRRMLSTERTKEQITWFDKETHTQAKPAMFLFVCVFSSLWKWLKKAVKSRSKMALDLLKVLLELLIDFAPWRGPQLREKKRSSNAKKAKARRGVQTISSAGRKERERESWVGHGREKKTKAQTEFSFFFLTFFL